ncbi:MAG: N-acetylmuramoyl-L-alanine amidase [Mycobacteriaceae bacterium]
MPNRRPKPSIALSAVAALAVASPLAVFVASSSPFRSPEVDSAKNETPVVIPTSMSEIPLADLPTIILNAVEAGLEQFGITLPPITLPPLALPPIQLPPVTSTGTAASSLATPAPAESTDTPARAAVKEITQAEPFSLLALTWDGLSSTVAKVRAKQADGSWGPWFSAQPLDTGKSDAAPASGKQGTDPIYVGKTTAVQIAMADAQLPENQPTSTSNSNPNTTDGTLTGSPDSADDRTTLTSAPSSSAFTVPPIPKPNLGYQPVKQETPLNQTSADTVNAVLINPGSSTTDAKLDELASQVPMAAAAPNSQVNMPKIISRTQWGADESIRCSDPVIDDSLGGAVVHHTAGSNNYSKEESAEIVRAIYAYHAQTLGWCDIGYNALVDKYGQIFEGRAGGLDKPVQGAHTGGFNENTIGVAMMGDYTDEAPSTEQLNSLGSFLGWRLKIAGLDPQGTTEMISEGTEYTFISEGGTINLPMIFGHRDVGNTACPGDTGYQYLGHIRDIAAKTAAGLPGPSVTVNPLSVTASPNSATTPMTVGDLLTLLDPGAIAQKWLALGGPTGVLGEATSGERPAQGNARFATFQNGAIYWTPERGAYTILGAISQMWASLGFEYGELGLPISDEYPVPEGMRADFENGSLIFDKVSAIVTKVLNAYKETYEQSLADQGFSITTAPR